MAQKPLYEGTLEPQTMEDIHPTDDTHGYFAQGRDYESAFVNHKYTVQEKKLLAEYESLDYLPSHSLAYKQWLKLQPSRLDWDRWLMMSIIGFTVGFIGFLLHQLIDLIAGFKWELAETYIQERKYTLAWIWVLGYSLCFVIVGSGLVVFLRPSAAASGLPELIGFLNGTMVRHIFNVKTLLVKFFSCVCAVASGLPVGPEGPMISMGALVGAGVSQFRSETLGIKLPFFQRFRNSEDRRNFVSAGAAAGVASAFGAPVGGLLFAMEEVASFWNMKLSWMTFFCCMVSTFTTDLFNSAFEGFKYQGSFGLFKSDKYIMFEVRNGLDINIIQFIPTVILGMIGGFLGAGFTFINLKVLRKRREVLAKFSNPWHKKALQFAEPCLIMIIFATTTVFLPKAFKCSDFSCYFQDTASDSSPRCLTTPSVVAAEPSVSLYDCPAGHTTYFPNNSVAFSNQSFSQVATLLFVTGEEAILHLFSRETHKEFGYAALFTVLVIYYLLACWVAGTYISSGLVVPMLLIGALYGRIVGLIMVSLFGVHTEEYWSWMDPGAFALIGAASFFGGVSRLTMSLTVIMMEITNDIQFLLPIMVAVMVSKWVGDFFTHPIYHAILELKCIPFLDSEPVILNENNQNVNLELYSAQHAMVASPLVVQIREKVSVLAQLLLDNKYGGFPVIANSENDKIFSGLITRMELYILLMHEDLFETEEAMSNPDPEITRISYEQLSAKKLAAPQLTEELIRHYAEDPVYNSLYLNLAPYINKSSPSIPAHFSLHRTYIIFRTLGLRHLTVVDLHNQVVGILTRKDLMGFRMEERLAPIINTQGHQQGQPTVTLELPDLAENIENSSSSNS